MAQPLADGGVVRRLLTALLADELGRIRGRSVDAAEWSGWTDATRIDEDTLGVDSLARLELVARVNRFFHLHETGSEDYLVVRPCLGDWVEVIAWTLTRRAERISFMTSGSTGAAKVVTHALADLVAETDAHADLLPDAARVVALAPPHHIYGFLFTVLGPARRGLPVLDARASAPGRALASARPGDVVVGTPFLWDLQLRAGARAALGVTGVVSTAPCPPALWDALRAAGLGRLLEVYGSTETAGVGWRDDPAEPFRPLGHISRSGEGLTRADGRSLPLQDALDWRGAGFLPAGRLDGAVQVGGVNVHPDRVCAVLRDHPAVADCAVRLDGAGAGARLKAFVAPAAGAGGDDLAAELHRHCAARLTAPERPARYAFGPALPRTATGKPADWSVETATQDA